MSPSCRVSVGEAILRVMFIVGLAWIGSCENIEDVRERFERDRLSLSPQIYRASDYQVIARFVARLVVPEHDADNGVAGHQRVHIEATSKHMESCNIQSHGLNCIVG
jgi:hypothetical protein